MPAIGNIALTGGPTFKPRRIDGDQARYADDSGGIPVGYPTLLLSLRDPSPKSLEKNYLATVTVKIPTLEVTSPSTMTGLQPAPTVAYTCIGEMKFWLPARSTDVERAALNDAAYQLLNTSEVSAMLAQLEMVY